MADNAAPRAEELPRPEEMPVWVREALAEVSAAVEALNRDQQATIAEQAFERSAELRERAEHLRQRKAAILLAWRDTRESWRAEPGAAADGGRDLGSS